MKDKNSFFSTLVVVWLGLTALVLLVGIMRGEGTADSYIALARSRDHLKEALAKLRKETDDLEEEISKIKTSKEYAKKVFKDKYHATETDENIIFFPD